MYGMSTFVWGEGMKEGGDWSLGLPLQGTVCTVEAHRLRAFPAFQHHGQRQVSPHQLMRRLRRTVAPSHTTTSFLCPPLPPLPPSIHPSIYPSSPPSLTKNKPTVISRSEEELQWFHDGCTEGERRSDSDAIKLLFTATTSGEITGDYTALSSCSLDKSIRTNVTHLNKVYKACVWACVCKRRRGWGWYHVRASMSSPASNELWSIWTWLIPQMKTLYSIIVGV